MTRPLPEPREFEDTTVWLKRINREWQMRPPVDLYGSISPNSVEAASGHRFLMRLRVGERLSIPPGAHITFEVPATWEMHLGNCFRRAVRTVGSREQVMPGYGAITTVACSNAQVTLALHASYGRILDLVDIVVVEGTLGPGDEVWVTLGAPESNPVQVQKHAQVTILPVGVDLAGDGQYRRAVQHPTVTVVGASADRLRVYAPAVVAPGEPFGVRVLPVDIYSYNPATGYSGNVSLQGAGVELPAEHAIDTTRDPFGVAVVGVAPHTGIARVTAVDTARGIAGRSNPILVSADADEQLYCGELHSQMWHSMGTGTPDEFFSWGRDVAGLDFCAPANHFNWRFEVTPDILRKYAAAIERHNAPGQFVTLPSYEWGGSGDSGHKNVYFRDATEADFSYWYRGQPTPDDLWNELEARDALTIPHHTKAFQGVNWGYRNDRFQRLVEICSNWGISEEGGDHCVQAALAMGHRLGFVGGTDSHYGLANQGSYHVNDGNGLACVWAPELTREAIWQALYDRHCYATTGDRILLRVDLDGHPMGSDLPTDIDRALPRAIHVQVAGTDRIDAVEILRNNEVVFATSPMAEEWENTWIDTGDLSNVVFPPTFAGDRAFVFYCVRVTQANRQIAWSSPIWLTATTR